MAVRESREHSDSEGDVPEPSIPYPHESQAANWELPPQIEIGDERDERELHKSHVIFARDERRDGLPGPPKRAERPTFEVVSVELPSFPWVQSKNKSSREIRESEPEKPEKDSETFVYAELSAAVKDTFNAILNHALKVVADAHGLGPLLRGAELALAVAKWIEVGEGHRELDVTAPIPLGSGIELDLSAHAGHLRSAAEPLITGCFVPASGLDPGVLVVDGYQISPGDTINKESPDKDGEAAIRAQEQTEESSAGSVSDDGQVLLVPLDLSELMSKEGNPRIRADVLMHLSRNQLVPRLKQQGLWNKFEAASVECVVCYDQNTKDSVWLFLAEHEKRSVRRTITF